VGWGWYFRIDPRKEQALSLSYYIGTIPLDGKSLSLNVGSNSEGTIHLLGYYMVLYAHLEYSCFNFKSCGGTLENLI